MLPVRTFAFNRLEPTPELPAQLCGLGHEQLDSADYRWDNERHQHRNFHIFQYTMAGEGRFRWRFPNQENHQASLVRGDLFIASPDIEFEYRHPGNGTWDFLWVILEGPHVDRAVVRLRDSRGSPIIQLTNDAPFVQAMELQFRRQLIGQMIDAWGLSLQAWELVSLLYRLAERPMGIGRDSMADLARSWVVQHPRKARSSALAGHFGYNPKYFASLFQQETGLSPSQFIISQKMALAQVWLSTTSKPIGRIAHELGFSEDNYFSKVFRRQTGQSPSAFRKHGEAGMVVDEVVMF